MSRYCRAIFLFSRPFFLLFSLIDWRANWVYQHYLLFLPILLIILLPLEIFFLWVFSSCVGWIWLYCGFLLKTISHFSFENTYFHTFIWWSGEQIESLNVTCETFVNNEFTFFNFLFWRDIMLQSFEFRSQFHFHMMEKEKKHQKSYKSCSSISFLHQRETWFQSDEILAISEIERIVIFKILCLNMKTPWVKQASIYSPLSLTWQFQLKYRVYFWNYFLSNS